MRVMASPTPPLLSSSSNPSVRTAIALRERRERDRTGRTLIDGAREVRRAFDAGLDIVEVFVCEARLAGADARAVLDRLAAGSVIVHPTTEGVFAKLAYGDRSEGLVAIATTPTFTLADLPITEAALVVVLERIEKPGNLGAVLRTADGVGADAVVVADPLADLYNPNTIRASAGTVFSVPSASATTTEVLGWLRAHAFRIVAARVDGPRLYTDATLTGRLAVVLGSEADGLSGAWTGDDIEAVRLPMLGMADSLNVSVTAAILLYEAHRQRGEPADGPRT